eukprot:scaffold88355_cov78-Phaeocystis_antarctica.AAC.2
MIKVCASKRAQHAHARCGRRWPPARGARWRPGPGRRPGCGAGTAPGRRRIWDLAISDPGADRHTRTARAHPRTRDPHFI